MPQLKVALAQQGQLKIVAFSSDVAATKPFLCAFAQLDGSSSLYGARPQKTISTQLGPPGATANTWRVLLDLFVSGDPTNRILS